ncbi:N-acetyltransferase [Pacificimonas sp. WHA3]|uniref:N-acetyltransferase n=1 Tax=Pacificimonas pallii TaxID=2827236 RepID=A0ABS6SIP7_9SPHN|nr:GNAT family N-acetyltransferase [Pacificimonas pallii]MBV7257732.1 N-acetyltransferase [Pacificimonas pallii]
MAAPRIELVPSASAIPAAAWDACAGTGNPFATHAFAHALEQSGSVSAQTGWTPAHLAVRPDEAADPVSVMPAYVKTHSRGEFVFDHGWAEAFERAGGQYYPKLQISTPFTPATGPRLLTRSDADPALLLKGAEAVCRHHSLSSAHATFIPPEQLPVFRDADWLIRHGEQFHWFNRDYRTFDDFLGALSSRKRKTIRRERRGAADSGLRILQLRGADIREEDWDDFWVFYQDTGARKWGSPYLTRSFFTLMSQMMADRLLLVVARMEGRTVAAALNFIGGDCLYGRYWGTVVDVPFLHFELCYYQAIDFAIAHGLARVEAGAQGPHKLARGYEPVTTYSAHFIADAGLRTAVAEFLTHERDMVARDIEIMRGMTPFRRDEG